MKKGKKLILIILLLMVCGCDVKYNVNINGNKVSEKIILPNEKNYTYDKLNDLIYYDIDNNRKYNAKIKKDRIILTNRSSDFKKIANNSKYRFCFDSIVSTDNYGYYALGTSSGFKCMRYDDEPIDEVTVVLNTFNKVTEHNADETKFGKYIWYFDKYNSKDKSIYFVVKKNDFLWYYRFRGLILGLASVLVLVIVGYLIVKVFKNRSNRENEI